jgi:hypothetical protein
VLAARDGLATAPDPVNSFFAQLAEPGHLAALEGQTATLRFDVADGPATESWRVAVVNGDVSVSREAGAADAVIRAPRPVVERIVTGRLNGQAALLRGLVVCEGSMAALVMFQRCLPGPPGSTGRVAPISGATVMKQRRAM